MKRKTEKQETSQSKANDQKNIESQPKKIITQEDMIPRLMKKTNLSEAEVREVLTLFPQVIRNEVLKGKTVTIEDLGEFSPSSYVPQSRQETGTKPKTRVIFKPAKKNIRFKPGKDLQ